MPGLRVLSPWSLRAESPPLLARREGGLEKEAVSSSHLAPMTYVSATHLSNLTDLSYYVSVSFPTHLSYLPTYLPTDGPPCPSHWPTYLSYLLTYLTHTLSKTQQSPLKQLCFLQVLKRGKSGFERFGNFAKVKEP